jgi:DNA-binding response OmpR family regulator
MPAGGAVTVLYLFENYSLDVDRRELRYGAGLVPAEPKVFDLLHFLICNRERVVSKEDLIAHVWNGRIVSDSALTSRVTLARQAIGDSGDDQRLIRTIPRKGFRFVGDVRESTSAGGVEPTPAPRGAAPAIKSSHMTILVIDDHALIREALHGVLRDLNSEAIVLEASNAQHAMQIVANDPKIELILLDLKLPDRDGFEVLAELRERYSATSVVVLSASEARDDIARALDLGALGFIPKSASRKVMLTAFNLIFAGGIYVPPEILGRRTTKP